jgi:hypothetical protein
MIREILRVARKRVAAVEVRVWPGRGIGRIEIGDQTPLRAELFSADQMEQHGKVLAGSHVLRKSRGRDQLLRRLDDNEQVLTSTCRLLTGSSNQSSGSRPPVSGCSTIFTSSKSRSASPENTCPRDTAANCRAWRKALRRAAAGLRPRAGGDLARRRTRGRSDPGPVRAGLPGGNAAAPGRALGDSDHAAACAH